MKYINRYMVQNMTDADRYGDRHILFSGWYDSYPAALDKATATDGWIVSIIVPDTSDGKHEPSQPFPKFPNNLACPWNADTRNLEHAC
jgi:hypothetical protein